MGYVIREADSGNSLHVPELDFNRNRMGGRHDERVAGLGVHYRVCT